MLLSIQYFPPAAQEDYTEAPKELNIDAFKILNSDSMSKLIVFLYCAGFFSNKTNYLCRILLLLSICSLSFSTYCNFPYFRILFHDLNIMITRREKTVHFITYIYAHIYIYIYMHINICIHIYVYYISHFYRICIV